MGKVEFAILPQSLGRRSRHVGEEEGRGSVVGRIVLGHDRFRTAAGSQVMTR
jgi:hypothetical protein